MFKLAKTFSKMTVRLLSYQLTLVAVLLMIGGFARLSYQQFLYLQAQSISGLSVFNEVIIPLAGLTLIGILLLLVISSAQLVPRMRQSNQFFLLANSPMTPSAILSALGLSLGKLSVWPLVYFGLIVAVIGVHSDLDGWRLLSLLLGLCFLWLSMTLLALWLSLHASKPLLASLLLIVVSSLLIVVDFWVQSSGLDQHWHGLILPLFAFREGIIDLPSIAHYLGVGAIIFGFALAGLAPQRAGWKRFNFWIIGLGGLIIVSASQFHFRVDVSADSRSTLSASLIEKLKKNANLLKITAVVNDETSHQEIRRGLQLLALNGVNTELEFHSRQSLGPEVQSAGEFIQFQLGELYQSVSYPFERPVKQVFEVALQRLLLRKQQWITFVDGHGEASPFGKQSSDLGRFYQSLVTSGWPVAQQNLTQVKGVPNNTRLLVIASSKYPWLPGEDAQVLNYLKAGGNMLLLLDPDSEVPESLQEYIGVSRHPGTLIDWQGHQSGTPHPAIVVVDQLGEHPLTANLQSLLAFPWSSGLKVNSNQDKLTVVLQTNKSVWNELQVDAERVAFDEDAGELQQPFALAYAYQDEVKQQKIVVVGDSHFLSDSAINNYANQQLGLNIVSWLTGQETFAQEASKARDADIRPSRWGHLLLNWGFSLLGPLLLMVYFTAAHFRRRQVNQRSHNA